MGEYGGRVDIGTEWNLEVDVETVTRRVQAVDIGTEWNLENRRSAL